MTLKKDLQYLAGKTAGGFPTEDVVEFVEEVLDSNGIRYKDIDSDESEWVIVKGLSKSDFRKVQSDLEKMGLILQNQDGSDVLFSLDQGLWR